MREAGIEGRTGFRFRPVAEQLADSPVGAFRGLAHHGDRMADRAAVQEQTGPVTLHRVMASMIAEGLKAHYRPPRRLSHELFVLLLQIKERGAAAAAKPPPPRSNKRLARRKVSIGEAALP